jgi:hypothetical protein
MRITLCMVMLGTLIFVLGCRFGPLSSGPPPAKQPGATAERAVTQAPAASQAEPPQADEALTGQITYSLDGNIHFMDLVEREPRQLTMGGVPETEAGLRFGCPSFVDQETLLFLRWESDDQWHVTSRTIASGSIESEWDAITEVPYPTALGWSTFFEEVFALWQIEEGMEPGDDFGALLQLCAYDGDVVTDIEGIRSWFGGVSINQARIRVSPDGAMVSIPNFPTDVSDFYVLHDLETAGQVELLPQEVLGSLYITALDFGDGTVYGAINDITEEQAWGNGLYRLDLETFEHEKILALDGSHGIAVSETLQLAVMSTAEDDLILVDLATGNSQRIGRGTDPDIWPR